MKKSKIAIFIAFLGIVFVVSGVLGYLYSSNNANNGDSKTLLVQFDANGGKVETKEKKVVVGNVYGELPAPEKKGYTFDGWFTEKDGGEKVDDKSIVTIEKNHVLYASWTYNIYDLEPIVSVNTTSKEDGDYFGGLYSSSKYTGDMTSDFYDENVTYADNSGNLQYDSEGALLLDDDNAIAILDVDKKYLVADTYSISTTISGDYTQGGGIGGEYARGVAAISGEMSHYLCWIGIYKNHLHVYSFIIANPDWGVNYPISKTGFASIDISSYVGQTININVVGVRDKRTKVYINGNLVSDFGSGNDVLNYDHLVLGDLRPGRSLKFVGKIYDFAIFDKELTDDQAMSNFENSKANKK